MLNLIGICKCQDKRDCWHGPNRLVRTFECTGRLLILNRSGYVRAVDPQEVE